jgi:hypothetical protein
MIYQFQNEISNYKMEKVKIEIEHKKLQSEFKILQ